MAHGKMSGQIFISYRREDSAAAAGRVYDRLSESFPSNRIFIDVDNIAPGVDFVKAIEKSVGSCEFC
jgi:TIR domain